MNQTLSMLRARLGRPLRFQIDAEPGRRKRSVVAHVRWTCGCAAEGTGFDALGLAPCAAHVAVATEQPVRRFPGFTTLLGRA